MSTKPFLPRCCERDFSSNRSASLVSEFSNRTVFLLELKPRQFRPFLYSDPSPPSCPALFNLPGSREDHIELSAFFRCRLIPRLFPFLFEFGRQGGLAYPFSRMISFWRRTVTSKTVASSLNTFFPPLLFIASVGPCATGLSHIVSLCANACFVARNRHAASFFFPLFEEPSHSISPCGTLCCLFSARYFFHIRLPTGMAVFVDLGRS